MNRDNIPVVPAATPVPKEIEVTPTGHIDEVSVDYQPQIVPSQAFLRQTADDWVRCMNSPDSPENRALFLKTRTRMNDAEMLYLGYRPGMTLLPHPQNAAMLPPAIQSMIQVSPLIGAVAPITLQGLDLTGYGRANSFLGHVRDIQGINRPYNHALDVLGTNLEQYLDYGARTFYDRTNKIAALHFEIGDVLNPLRSFVTSPAEAAQETRKKIAKALSSQGKGKPEGQAKTDADPKAPPPVPTPPSPPPAVPTPGLDPRYRG